MSLLSDKQKAIAREAEAALSQAISIEGQLALCKRLGVDKDAFNRFYGNKNGWGMKQLCEMLALLGLKVVDKDQPMLPSGCQAVADSICLMAYRDALQVHGRDNPQVLDYRRRMIAAGLFVKRKGGRVAIPFDEGDHE